MKVIIAGSRRGFISNDEISSILKDNNLTPTEIFSGGARGIDACGEIWASDNNIKLSIFPAQWDIHGKAAGPIRNKQMADGADVLVAILYPDSRGTLNMINTMKKLKKKTIVVKKGEWWL